MSTTSIYFIPSDVYEEGQFEKKVIRILKEMDIIDEYYDEEDNLWASSGSLSFEYASVHDSNNYRLIPESSSVGYGSTCYNCHKEVDDTFYDVINDHYDLEDETGKERDMREIELICPHCKTRQTLKQLTYKEPVAFANQYFQFVDISDDVDEELISNLQHKLESDLTLIYERM